MSVRKLFLVLIAFVVAGGTVQFVRMQLHRPAARAVASAPAPVAPELRVLVAAANLPAGRLVRADDLKWRAWPTDGSVKTYMVEGKRTVDEFVGAVVRQGVRAGEPIVEGRLVKPGERGFLAAVLNPDMRAVSVQINPVTGIAGFVFPGDRVDVILTHSVTRKDDPELPTRRASETVLTDVRVLAIDQKTDDQAAKPALAQIATLEVTPKQAETVMLVSELGQLSLSLRSLRPDEAVAGDDTAPAALMPVAAVPPLGLQPQPWRPAAGRGYTWDSDVSMVLPPPGDKDALVRRVHVGRGAADPAELVFARKR